MTDESPNDLIAKVRDEYDADLIVYFGNIARPKDDLLIRETSQKKRRKNVVLHLATYGGDAHAAYRIARTLQRRYSPKDGKNEGKFYAYISSACWSAGTLLAMGADELILSDHAELGPIDVQLRKSDEVGDWTSGLTPVQALESLTAHSMEVFTSLFSQMRFGQVSFSTSLASKISADLTGSLVGKLYEQIDPMRIAEINRFLKISHEYGRRIARNLKPQALDQLLMSYPAHDFVIDPKEAAELFQSVTAPTPSLEALGTAFKPLSRKFLAAPEAQVTYIGDQPPAEKSNETEKQKASGSTRGKRSARTA